MASLLDFAATTATTHSSLTSISAQSLLSTVLSLGQSVAWAATVEGLNWAQTHGPMLLEWDVFLFGAVFLAMHIDPASIDQDWYTTPSPQEQQRQQSLRGPRVPSRSNSLSKRVTFDERIMVLGNISGLPLSLSPIPESFSYEDHQLAMMIDAQMIAQKLQQQEFDSNLNTMAPQPRAPSLVQSPASSPSSSCRSSICSVSSLSSFSSVSSVSSASSGGSDSGAKKSRSASSRLASIFHTSPKNQQSIPRAMSDGEYQPGIHRRKSLIQRLGLKKNKTV